MARLILFLSVVVVLRAWGLNCTQYIHQELQNAETAQILTYVFHPSHTSDPAALRAYKSQPRNEPLTLDLSDPGKLKKPSPIPKEIEVPHLYDVPTEYDIGVLALKSGDTVVFGRKTFKLGRFLGRGNENHVWEIADMPGYALRIPFDIGVNRIAGQVGIVKRQLRMRTNLNFLRQSKHHVEIKDYDMGEDRYSVVKMVNGEMSGDHLLSKISGGKINTNSIHSLVTASELSDYMQMGEEGRRLGLLIQALQDDNILPGDLLHDGARQVHAFSLDLARQFMYDEVDHCWYRVDGN